MSSPSPEPAAPLFNPADFRIPPCVTHVCAGGETPFLHRHDAAFVRYAEDKSDGPRGRAAQDAAVEEARALAATRFGVAAGAVGFVSSVAEGVSMLAESLAWQPGDNVVLAADEYPSVAAPFALAQSRGLAVRLVPGAAMAAAPFATMVDGRTRLIAVSAVSYLNGARADLPAFRRLADQAGAMLVVDFTQGAGYLPIEAGIADFAFSACYKWLLGTTGVAVAIWNRERQPGWAPSTAGWYSIAGHARPDYAGGLALQADAMRFTRGNPAHGPVYVLRSALDYLAHFDTAAVQRHVQGLTAGLLARLAALGIASTTPAEPACHGASVCIEHGQASSIADGLVRRGVYVWNGRGRVRFSFHGYNCAADLDRIVGALAAEWPG